MHVNSSGTEHVPSKLKACSRDLAISIKHNYLYTKCNTWDLGDFRQAWHAIWSRHRHRRSAVTKWHSGLAPNPQDPKWCWSSVNDLIWLVFKKVWTIVWSCWPNNNPEIGPTILRLAFPFADMSTREKRRFLTLPHCIHGSKTVLEKTDDSPNSVYTDEVLTV